MLSLTKYEIWNFVPNADTLESFQAKVLKPIFLKLETPSDIIDNITIVEKLLLHSYFEYEFIDVALAHAIFTFEKAMKLKYKEQNSVNGNNLKFSFLINWFFNNNYFETTNKDVPDQLRHIRNGKTHNEITQLYSQTL